MSLNLISWAATADYERLFVPARSEMSGGIASRGAPHRAEAVRRECVTLQSELGSTDVRTPDVHQLELYCPRHPSRQRKACTRWL
jgi:hypothetical protein